MSVSIIPGQTRITITSSPAIIRPSVGFLSAEFKSQTIRVKGEITLTGKPGDSALGWAIGWTQILFTATNWAYYRGLSENDGSLFIQAARPPALAQNLCIDTASYSPTLYEGFEPYVGSAPASGNFPMRVEAIFDDTPQTKWDILELNSLTEKFNYLREAQIEFHFCTILTLEQPGVLHYQHLAHFYWNMRWQARFAPIDREVPTKGNWEITPVAGGSGANVGNVYQGVPTDKRFAEFLKSDKKGKHCNELHRDAIKSAKALGSPNRRESRNWENFDVRR